MLEKIKNFLVKPFRNIGESLDKRPTGSQIKDYASIVKVAEANHELIIVVPNAKRMVGRLTVEGAETEEQRHWFAKGYNASLSDVVTLRRSIIKPTIKAYKDAVKAQRQAVKAVVKEEKSAAEAEEKMSRIPPAGTMSTTPAGA